MKSGCFVSAIISVLPAFTATIVNAGPNPHAKIAVHIKAHSSKAGGICSSTLPPCNPGGSLTVQGNTLTPYDLYLVVVDADTSDGVGGASFGISYNDSAGAGIDIFSWTLCADAEYRGAPTGKSWPASTSGNVIVWDITANCKHAPASGDLNAGVTAVMGVFYLYAYSVDTFSLTPRTYVTPSEFSVVDCRLEPMSPDYPGAAGKAGFGTTGADPCQ